jgi:hypothetical protein
LQSSYILTQRKLQKTDIKSENEARKSLREAMPMGRKPQCNGLELECRFAIINYYFQLALQNVC